MNIENIDAPSANISLPLNESVQKANGAQFALMLSLMMESHPASPSATTKAIQPVASSVKTTVQAPQSFYLETSQTRALQTNNMHHFNLLHSLYDERVMAVDESLQQAGAGNSSIAEAVLQEIEQGHSANSLAGREAEKVSFAA